MADHPTGIYQFTAVNIPAYVTVTFLPNPNNTPVVWLVQSNVVINGIVDVSEQSATGTVGGAGGPGGWGAGSGGSNPTAGQGPGGGAYGFGGTFGSQGSDNSWMNTSLGGQTYGNIFLLPLRGGSGGGGMSSSGPYYGQYYGGAGGGGGGILVAASGSLEVNGQIRSIGGNSVTIISSVDPNGGGSGSGGSIRLAANTFIGTGNITVKGGACNSRPWWVRGGLGRVRVDTLQNSFAGNITGIFTAGSQFIILPTAG